MRRAAAGLRRVFVILLLALLALPAAAHKPSDSYLRITETSGTLQVSWDLALRDLELLVGLDADGDGAITWGELRRQRDAIAAAALSRLTLSRGGVPVPTTLADLRVDHHSDGAYAVLDLDLDAGPLPDAPLRVRYDLLFDDDPTHRGLILYTGAAGTRTHILSPARREVELDPTSAPGAWATFADYVVEGVWHIWIGFDHILFLVSLLLTAVWTRYALPPPERWEPADTLRPALLAVLRLVTVFTLAHTLTLWLSVAEIVTLPSRWVEATIAASIVVAAVHNLKPVLPLPGWLIALVFGLIHGFGFAGVLMDLGLSDSNLAVSLLGFNLGVELGQLAIVAALFPGLFALRATAFYRNIVVRGGSGAIIVIALIWVVERAGNIVIPGL